MSEDSNPVRSEDYPIPFDRMRPEHVVPGIRAVLSEARERVSAIADADDRRYANTIRAMDRVAERVRRAVKPVRHLTAVAETPELREAYEEILPEISRFWSWLYLHQGLWEAVREAAESDEARALEGVHARHRDRTVRDFRRAGADLPPDSRERLREIRAELSSLEQRFAENVLDATAEWELRIADASRLEGIPDDARARYRERAEERDVDGWVLTLDRPSYEPVLKHAHDRELRNELHRAYTGRCRDGDHDNRPVVRRILSLRQEMAELLGHPDFADYRLEEAMAGSGRRARSFVDDLVERTRPYFERDVSLLRRHAGELGIGELEPWDVSYVRESLRRRRWGIDDETLRPYFPLRSALRGLFGVVERVFGLVVHPVAQVSEAWHEDVRRYRVEDEGGRHLGDFYADFHPRKEKRQGAWMTDFITGGPDERGEWRPHLGSLATNFPPPGGDTPSLLTHREVETLFHEFGHVLHHLTSTVPVEPRSGLNVAWDWVEVPSQIMENWTWEWDALTLFARHHETGEGLSAELFERMRAARRFMGGWDQMRQLSFGTMDLALHREFARDGADGDVVAFVERRLEPFCPGPEFARRNILTSFHHLFSGGYAAGYYSYLWSEVLEADAFRRFRSEGVFDRATGRRFVDSILSRGDSDEPERLFRNFMGRDPDPEALLKRNLGPLEQD